jgi:hypothetical protein
MYIYLLNVLILTSYIRQQLLLFSKDKWEAVEEEGELEDDDYQDQEKNEDEDEDEPLITSFG